MAEKKNLGQGVGGKDQPTPGQISRQGVDVKTGKPKPTKPKPTKTYGERAMSYLEGLGTKVAPPGSVTRLRETGARAPRTMSERLGSISRTASKTFPGKGTRPGGIIDIPAMAGETKGPSLKAQKATPAAIKRRAAMSLAERKRKGLRVTGAHVPKHGAGPTVPTGDKGTKVEVLKGPGELGKGHLGSYKVTGTKPPAPKVARAPAKRKKIVAKKEVKKSLWQRMLAGAKELSAEATRESQKYEEKTAGKKKTVKKVQTKLESLPPTPKRK